MWLTNERLLSPVLYFEEAFAALDDFELYLSCKPSLDARVFWRFNVGPASTSDFGESTPLGTIDFYLLKGIEPLFDGGDLPGTIVFYLLKGNDSLLEGGDFA